MNNVTALCVMGTRPEAIKMAPVVRALRARGFHAPIVATAQHRHLLDQVLGTFNLKADWDLDSMRPNQNLSVLMGRMLPELERLILDCHADVVLAQGDTTTVAATAIAALHARVPFAHVEAGLRSGDLNAPFPEEANRRLTSAITRFHFAPTQVSVNALRREGIESDTIHLVGNTVIDALLETAARPDLPWPEGTKPLGEGERLALVTLHRRENFGDPLRRILGGLRAFSEAHPETRLIYPVHPNPNVCGPAKEILGHLPNVALIEPVEYTVMVGLMRSSYALFTDSGGIQEEGPALGKPVLVFRDITERPESVSAGAALLVGSDPNVFLEKAEALWSCETLYLKMAQPRFPYGDGTASRQIAEILAHTLGNA